MNPGRLGKGFIDTGNCALALATAFAFPELLVTFKGCIKPHLLES